ncbi:MAG: TonB-dependent receptor [Gemmatimonadetes bacterium]|nr:TonB-dependent receptor [Gemmatimonadota bacterium]
MLRTLLSALLFAVVPVLALHAQTAPTGVITGRVVAAVTEAPLAGAIVTLADPAAAAAGTGATTTRTDSSGRFTLRDVPVGIARLTVRLVGYTAAIRGDIAISPFKPAEVTITLEPARVQLEQVTVRPDAFPAVPAASTPVSTQRYDAEEVRRQPGAQEDVLRAISIAPGVGVTSPARNDLVVRGGAPAENLFVIDNIEVPNINHFGSQGSTGGPISLINVRFVENAAISAGGYGVRLGDRTSSATTITLREGNRERVAGEVNVAATQVGAVIEGPISRNATFLANVRQSYLDLLFKAIGLSFIPSYTDATAKLAWRPTARDALSFLVIGARGTVTFDNDTDSARVNNAQVLAPTQTQYFSGLTWKRLVTRGVLTTTLARTETRYRSAQRDSLLMPVFESRSREGESTLRTDATWALTPALELEAGTVWKYADALRFDATLAGIARRDNLGAPRPLRVDTTFRALRNGTYAQLAWRVHPALRVTGGLRHDWYDFLGGATRFTPRGSVALQLDARTTLSVAGGRYWQPPSYIWLIGAPQNAATLRPFRADHLVAGVSRVIAPELKVQLEVYAKRYGDYPVRPWRPQAVFSPSGFDDVTTDIPFGLEPLASTGTGDARGVELFAQKKLGATPWYGQLAVSWNRTRTTALDGIARRGAFDTPWLGNLVLGWRPNARWELATRIRAGSGAPYTPFVEAGASAGTLDFTRANGERLAPFFAADVRIDRRWLLRGRQLIGFIDLQNATNRENEAPPSWDLRALRVRRETSIGLLPSIGLNLEF